MKAKTSQTLYVSLRQKLDDLGYNLFLSNDSTPLVEKIVADLVNAKETCDRIAKENQQLVQVGFRTPRSELSISS